MAMTRWEPLDSLTPLREVMNQLFEESFLRPMRFGLGGRIFPVDIYETETDFVIEAQVPGVKPEDLKITALGDTISIQAPVPQAQKPTDAEQKPGTYVLRERRDSAMARTIELPSEIDPDNVEATYAHGVLTLHLPKVEAAKPKPVPVRVKETATAH